MFRFNFFNSNVELLREKELKTNLKTSSKNEIVVDKLSVAESDYGVGCVTEYYKGSKMKDEIYLQTSSKDELTWVNYISINGKREVFLLKMTIPNLLKTKMDIRCV